MGAFAKVGTETVDLLETAGYMPFNCSLTGKKIVPALGAVYDSHVPPQNLKGAWYSRLGGDYLVVDGEDNVFLSVNGTNFLTVTNTSMSTPFLIESRDTGEYYAALCGDQLAILTRNTAVTSRIFTGGLSCGACKNGRLFGADEADGLHLKWSGEGGLLDWQEGISGAGSAYLGSERGKILRLFDYGGELVVLREFGITRMSVSGAPEKFAVKNNDVILPRVFKDSAVQLDGGIFFWTEKGPYIYRNGGIKAFTDPLVADVSEPKWAICTDGHTYILCAKSKSLERRAVYVFDSEGSGGYIIDIPANFVAGYEAPVAYADDCCYFIESAGKFTFASGGIFGDGKFRTMNRIEVDCDGAVDIEVSNGEVTRKISGVKGFARIGLRGREFTVTLSADCEIRGARVVAGGYA